MSPLSSGQGKQEKGKGEGGGHQGPICQSTPQGLGGQTPRPVRGSMGPNGGPKSTIVSFLWIMRIRGCLGVVHDAEGYQQMVPGVGGNMCCGSVGGNVGT